ncbi:MAG TPA: SDR family NAD(P)-dependent oxidoreductase [Stellaceae bacterium]|nr:SDR family NAD(P)-dependent oxidoreductase [Stellaceae bacterium]
MPDTFAGKTVLVTGGGSGIGAATCRAMAAAGASVAVIDRDGEAAQRVAASLGNNPGASAHRLDVSDGAGFAKLAGEIAAASGGIDVLVNCAGTITQKTLGTMTAEEWDRVISVNLGGTFNGIQAVLPHMKARGAGAVVNIASIAGRRISFGGGANYSASKAGVLGLTRHAAYELAPDKIRVNAVCPGPTATPFSGTAPSPEQKAARGRKIPLGRMVEPEDIADAVLFLASDAARMVTGIALDVDGGVLISNDIPYEDYFARMK